MDFFLSPDFRALAERLMKQHHVPGLAIAVVEDDKISSSGYGKARLDSSLPCTPDTLFDIASCSKSLTAASIGLLVEDNENYPDVRYTATMSTLLPDDFVMPQKDYTDGVTLDDVLSHRTGMGRHDSSYRGPRAKDPDTPRSVTRNLRNLPLVAPLRSKHMYNNMMYTVLTHLLEIKTQHTFFDFLQKQFFEPLGMRSSSLQPASARDKGIGDRLAMGYTWNKPTKSFRGFEIADSPEAQGAGSIITSANDFILWVKALINHEGPISGRVYQGLVRLRSIMNPGLGHLKRHKSPAFYAAGLEVYFYRGHMVVGHDGGVPGFASRFFFLPDLKFGAVMMGNSGSAYQAVSTLANKLIDKVIGVPDSDTAQNKQNGKVELSKRNELKNTPQPTEKIRKDKKEVLRDKAVKGEDNVKGVRKPVEPQQTPLKPYTGDYWNPGYHTFTVEIRNGELFIDATDRSLGFTLTFEHISNEREYIAHLSDIYEEGDEPLESSFVFEHDTAMKLGIRIEPEMTEMIWFERVAERC